MESDDALVREGSHVVWFHWSLHCQRFQEVVAGVSTCTGCLAPHLASGPTTTRQSSFKPNWAGFPSWSKTCLQVSPRAGLWGMLQWICWVFSSRGIQPALSGKMWLCAEQHKKSRAEQGYWTLGFREENCPSSSCQGKWTAGEETIWTCN